MKISRSIVPALVVALILSLPALARAAGHGADGRMESYAASLPAEPLSHAEKEGLAFMFEEEKLARDVYAAMDTAWNDRIFSNIASSEQQHMDSIRTLLVKYGLPVPADTPGQFDDPLIRELFEELTGAGRKSLTDGLRVGATIEDLDIADLKSRLADADNRDIRVVYQNLMKGSRNHLRSFSARLDAAGAPYEARHLRPSEVRAIVTSPNERGMLDENGRPVR
ncbi:DUF2202 domain-containing protein [Pseudodesulfovibrio portus]|uniref:DUF2202 domain-containing protein n=1 Tax=Pseudodesulfovibrio portus TaxID=231439 RepID=A0ABM8APZ5_9BACT|nr:DUF2202 domain-containing protein [Pseudodesulfovibrio portus]BDQ33484.1 hypothetical protein JCM14722_10260 [Pseudodesulfovibrio portus]